MFTKLKNNAIHWNEKLYFLLKKLFGGSYYPSLNLTSTLGNSNFKKVFLIRGGEYNKTYSPGKDTYSPGTQTMTQEEYTQAYGNEINLDELDDINRLNRAYKPKKVLSGNKTYSLKDKANNSVIDKPVIDKPVIDKPVIDKPVINNPIIDKPIVDKPVIDEPIMDEPVVEKPFVDKPIENKPIMDNKPIVDEPAVEKPFVNKPINNKPTIDEAIVDDKKNDLINNNEKEDYKNTKRILDERKKEFEKMKEEFRRNDKRKIISTSSNKRIPVSFTNKEIFDNFVFKNKIIIEFASYVLTFAILYFYLRLLKADIITNYKLLYINYKNKRYKDCIDPLVKLVFFLYVFLKISYSGPRTIKFISLKLFYYVYISIVFLKEKNFLINEISIITNKIIYPFAWIINLYSVLFKDLFKYLHGLGQQSIESSLHYLIRNSIGQTISHPLLTKFLIKLRSYFFKDPVEALACKVMDSAFDTFFAHKAEFQALLKMNKVFEEYKTYCLNNNKKDAIIDYLINNKIKLRLVSPLLVDYKADPEYFIKFNKLLCEIYNIKKNYAKNLSLKYIIFSNYKNFKPGTFLSKLFDDVAKFDFDDEIVRKENFKFLHKLFYGGTIKGTLPEWIYSSILIASVYGFDILELKKLFSIHTPAYIVNNKNFCRYLNCREIIYKVFYKNFYKLFLYTGLIFSSCIFFIYLRQIVPEHIKNYFFKKIEGIKKCFSKFFEEIPAIVVVSLLCLNLLYIQYLKYILSLL